MQVAVAGGLLERGGEAAALHAHSTLTFAEPWLSLCLEDHEGDAAFQFLVGHDEEKLKAAFHRLDAGMERWR